MLADFRLARSLKEPMAARTVRCTENLYRTIINDVYAHRDDTEYVVYFIGAAPEAKQKYLIQCENFTDAPKTVDEGIRMYIGEALRRAFGGEARVDTPYVVQRMPMEESDRQ